MSRNELRELIIATPFTPFHVVMGDGTRVPVIGRDFIIMFPSGDHVMIFQPDDSRRILDTRLILGVEYGPPAKSSNSQSNNSNP